MGVFGKNNQPDVNVARNTFDLSFQNNLTMQMGTLYPCFCKEVIPGDTFEIDTAFGLRFMPLAFPIQTRMKASVEFFYVRNRNLYDKFQSWITKTGSGREVLPHLSDKQACRQLKTGSLGDYLGLPTTIVGSQTHKIGEDQQFETTDNQVLLIDTEYFGQMVYKDTYSTPYQNTKNQYYFISASLNQPEELESLAVGSTVTFHFKSSDTESNINNTVNQFYPYIIIGANTSFSIEPAFSVGIPRVVGNDLYIDFKVNTKFNLPNNRTVEVALIAKDLMFIDPDTGAFSFVDTCVMKDFSTYLDTVVDASAFYNGEDVFPHFNINALPFRAYESIYNSFYRDQRNNPYILNGINDPNVYLPTTEGGSDDNIYDLHKKNWEQDFLTSAVPSPQQGVAPLVGLTSTGVATFADTDGTQYNVKMTTAEDGDTITGAEYTSNLPNSVARSIVNVATSGISINDFRGVNALQRWLETNMRRGLKYKDQLMSHFGVNPSYEILDMPEFLGGVSQSVDIQQINQTAPTDAPLGSYAGQAACVGGTNNTIRKYCDEHGYIIGIISVVPVPCYSQVLPKHFLKNAPLDYFFPEFGHLGMQPIKYNEVSPIQAEYNGVSLDTTFGYQRAWYDYIASVDEVHSQFRTDLKDFILSRVYNTLPSLNEEFLTVSPSQLNDIFTVNEIKNDDGSVTPIDPILGQIHFRCIAKRPIPRYGVPRLE